MSIEDIGRCATCECRKKCRECRNSKIEISDCVIVDVYQSNIKSVMEYFNGE